MARPSRMSKHPDICSSSFYLPRRLNYRFDIAIKRLGYQGQQTTRSEILAGLIDQWLDDPELISTSTWPDE